MASANSFYARLNARRHKGRSPQERTRDNAKQFQTTNIPIRRPSQSAEWNRGYDNTYSGNRRGY